MDSSVQPVDTELNIMSAETILRMHDRASPAADYGRLVDLHEAVRTAKAAFFAALADRSASRDLKVLTGLRQDSVYGMSEFFFLFRSMGIDTPQRIARYVDVHNAYIQELKSDRQKLTQLGLMPQRLTRAEFNDENKRKLTANFSSTPPTFDQSDLARLLAIMMSAETCRNTVITLAEAGFLDRQQSPYKAMLIRSTGTLEALFADHLAQLESSMRHMYGVNTG
jgi:hypothetical protein